MGNSEYSEAQSTPPKEEALDMMLHSVQGYVKFSSCNPAREFTFISKMKKA